MSNIKGRIAEICELESVASNPITDAITRKRVLNRIIDLRLYILQNSKNKNLGVVKAIIMFIIGLLFCMTIVGIPLGIVLMIPLLFYWSKAERRSRSEARMNFEQNAIEMIR
jgi:predicted membrane protein